MEAIELVLRADLLRVGAPLHQHRRARCCRTGEKLLPTCFRTGARGDLFILHLYNVVSDLILSYSFSLLVLFLYCNYSYYCYIIILIVDGVRLRKEAAHFLHYATDTFELLVMVLIALGRAPNMGLDVRWLEDARRQVMEA